MRARDRACPRKSAGDPRSGNVALISCRGCRRRRPSKYSRALLETLALVAYRQPITRSEIEETAVCRSVRPCVRTLQERNWIRVVGHREVRAVLELLGDQRANS